jgi:uncharacterized protein YndB with AHSA1/START domain
MHSFELKTVIAAPLKRVFAAITEPDYIIRWDYCGWVRNDMRLAGKLRKRDEEGTLIESEIVVWDPPCRFAALTPLVINPEEPDEGTFTARFEYSIEAAEGQSVLTLHATGFPTEDLCARERNSWGGYFLEKLKKVAENHRG